MLSIPRDPSGNASEGGRENRPPLRLVGNGPRIALARVGRVVGAGRGLARLGGDVAVALKLALSAWRCNAVMSPMVVAGAENLTIRI